MTRKRQLQTTAECRAIDRSNHRLAQLLETSELRLNRLRFVKEHLGTVRGYLTQGVQITTGEERFLGRSEYHTGQIGLGLKFGDGIAQ